MIPLLRCLLKTQSKANKNVRFCFPFIKRPPPQSDFCSITRIFRISRRSWTSQSEVCTAHVRRRGQQASCMCHDGWRFNGFVLDPRRLQVCSVANIQRSLWHSCLCFEVKWRT
ncbi:hypothetical protein GN956_G1361 [Arapaima gigas]